MDLAAPLAFAPCTLVTGCKDGLTYRVNRCGDWAVHKRGDPAKLAFGSTGSMQTGWIEARRVVDQLLKDAARESANNES